MRLVSYAQNCEDVMLWRALQNITSGFYIDVGAAWPDEDSVTKLFYDRGWKGVNVEPNPFLFHKLNQARTRDTNLNIAVDLSSGLTDFFLSRQTGLSSLKKSTLGSPCQSTGDFEDVQVVVSPLSGVWQKYVPSNQPVHFLKIDVEGAEARVIASNDWQANRPWIVVVESTRPGSQDETHSTWEPILLANEYSFVYADGLNRFYLAAEQSRLASAFKYPPNVFDGFVTRGQADNEDAFNTALVQIADLTNQLNAIRKSLIYFMTKPLFVAERKVRSYIARRKQ